MESSSIRRRLSTAVLAALVGMGAVGALAAPADAAGVVTHRWMATTAIPLVQDARLKALLQANDDEVELGAMFPDGGYFSTNTYGEEAHWGRFADNLADVIAEQDCGDITAADGPCAPLIGFLMGVMAHGMGDEVWDWLFEPNSPDRNEFYWDDDLEGLGGPGGTEIQMDIVAIGRYHRPAPVLPSLSGQDLLLEAFRRSGMTSVTSSQFTLAMTIARVSYGLESNLATKHLADVESAMPWMAANMITAPGGVAFGASAIAPLWETYWGRLQGHQPATKVSTTYPAADQTDIPASGWERDRIVAGSNPGTGGARNRIAAVVSYALPYRPGNVGPALSATLPAGAMTLTDVATGQPVPSRRGFPAYEPYGPDSGTHLVDFQPAEDLAPCTWYEASITSALVDARGQAVTPMSWRFKTDGTCPIPPTTTTTTTTTTAPAGSATTAPVVSTPTTGTATPTTAAPSTTAPVTGDAVERYIRAAYRDVLGRDPEPEALEWWRRGLTHGLPRPSFAAALVGSAEARGLLVDVIYLTDLGRRPDAAGRAYWVGRLARTSLSEVRAHLLASPEATVAHADDAAFVEDLYLTVLNRPVDAAGLAAWTEALGAGLSRTTVAKALLTSPEAARSAIADAYAATLDRQPSASEIAAWLPVVRGSDLRTVLQAIVGSDAYHAHVTD